MPMFREIRFSVNLIYVCIVYTYPTYLYQLDDSKQIESHLDLYKKNSIGTYLEIIKIK